MGKTCLVQGIALGVAVDDIDEVNSPTYTVVNEYYAKSLSLVHIDFYRLQDEDSAYFLGIDEQITRKDAIITIEWANNIMELIPEHAVIVDFIASEGDSREITIKSPYSFTIFSQDY